jgi:hypothetical protein
MAKSGMPKSTPKKPESQAPGSYALAVVSNPADSPREEVTSPPAHKIVIDGVKFDFEPDPKTLQQIQVATYSKAARAAMVFKEKTELFERASAKKLQPKVTMMNLKIVDPDKLDDTYNLSSAIDKMKENHIKFDLHDVFKVVMVDPEDPYKVLKTVDLYTDYGSIEVSDVAASNRFYSTMLRNPNGAISENLKVTLEYLVNNTDKNLVLKINETCLAHPVEERGGPLFFKLWLMDLLQNNSAEAAEYLVNVVKNLKISNFDGENVLKVVSLIRGAVKRLTNLKDARGQSALPTDLADHLLDVFQTGKFAPPTETEKKNQSRRLIDGKLYYYHYKSKHWNLVDKDNSNPTKQPGPPTTIAAGNLATLADNPPGTLTPVISNQTWDVAVANASRQLELTFRGLLSQLNEN